MVGGISPEQMTRLRELVHSAQDYVSRPFEPGETSRPFTFFTDHLDIEGWKLGWSVVSALREQHPDLFASFSEVTLHMTALDALLATDEVPSVDELAAIL